MTIPENSKTFDLTFEPPMHPGRIMKALLMPQRKLGLETVSVKSGLSLAWLNDFTHGDAEMTRGMRSPLRNVFGEAANTLYRMQLTYNYYQLHGKRPPGYRRDQDGQPSF